MVSHTLTHNSLTVVEKSVQIRLMVKLLLSCRSTAIFVDSDFLRKVYTLLSLQIILTTATSALFMFSHTIKEFVHAR